MPLNLYAMKITQIPGCFVIVLLLMAFSTKSFVDAIQTVRTPEKWHGFEVTIAWWTLYCAPVIVVAGFFYFWKASRKPRP